MPQPAPKDDATRTTFERLYASGRRVADIAYMMGMPVKVAFELQTAISAQQPRPEGSKMKRCLSCSLLFLSWGAGNRICPSCKSSDEVHDGPV